LPAEDCSKLTISKEKTGMIEDEPTGPRIAPSPDRGVQSMPLLNLVVALIVVGVALWAINRFIPMASSIKTILNVVVVVAVCIWVLRVVGLWGQISTFRI
jgi:hypothetical protein